MIDARMRAAIAGGRRTFYEMLMNAESPVRG